MNMAKNTNSVFIRCQPKKNHCSIKGALCLNLITPMNYQMGCLIGTIRDRLIKNNADIDMYTSIFLYKNNNLMTSFSTKIVDYWK